MSREEDDFNAEDEISEQIEYHLNKCLDEDTKLVGLFLEEVAEKFVDATLRIRYADSAKDRRDIESTLSAYIQVFIPAVGGAVLKLKKESVRLKSEIHKLSNEVELKISPYWLNEETRDLN